jgi:hypothetical protein
MYAPKPEITQICWVVLQMRREDNLTPALFNVYDVKELTRTKSC